MLLIYAIKPELEQVVWPSRILRPSIFYSMIESAETEPAQAVDEFTSVVSTVQSSAES